EAMRSRCPRAKPFNKLYLNKGLLVFRGVADVEGVDDCSAYVAGGIWKVTPECIRTLDAYEGVASGLYSKRYLVLKVEGQVKACLFYKMNSTGVQPPWQSYLNGIRQGYKDFGLDESLLVEAVQRSWADKNRTEDLHRRWIAKGKPELARIKTKKNGRKRRSTRLPKQCRGRKVQYACSS